MSGSILLSIFFVFGFAYAVFASSGYVPLARLFPLAISLVGLTLALVNLGQDLWRIRRHIANDSSMGLADLESDWSIPYSQVWARASLFMGLFLALYLGIWVLGYPLAMALFVILFYRGVAKAPIIISVVAGLAGLGFIVMVGELLNVSWPEGFLGSLFTLPWPLG